MDSATTGKMTTLYSALTYTDINEYVFRARLYLNDGGRFRDPNSFSLFYCLDEI